MFVTATRQSKRRNSIARSAPPLRVHQPRGVRECGDCGVKSNCVAVVPLATELGRKRVIDKFSCNKHFPRVEGFCPSVGHVKARSIEEAELAERFRAALEPPDAA